jgi:hypothetical protein
VAIQALQEAGFDKGCRFVTSDDFQDQDEYAAFIPPVACWELPQQVRAAILSGHLFFVCVTRRDIWEAAFRSRDLGYLGTEDGWRVTLDDTSILIDRLSVGRIMLGLPFSGVSPQQFADEVRRVLERERNENTNR